MADEVQVSGPVTKAPYAFILFIVFLVLKLTSVIGWSWWWITAPLWIPAVVVVACILWVHVRVTRQWNKALAARA